VAGHASHFDEGCHRIGERSDGTNQIEHLDVLCKSRPTFESVLARDNQLRIGEGDACVPDFGFRRFVKARMVAADASERAGNAEFAISCEILGLLFVLLEVWTGG
jgi:hypothetical protein